MKIFFTFFMTAIVLSASSAQHDHTSCGMTTQDQQPLIEFVDYFNKTKESASFSQRTDKLNVPIKFHSVALDDGTQRISSSKILRQFERLRTEFAAVGMNIYMSNNDFNYINNSAFSIDSESHLLEMQNQKDPEALNIFVIKDVAPGFGFDGYYYGGLDFVAIEFSAVNENRRTITHELGHMFSLVHTFFGWEGNLYNENTHGNPLTWTYSPNDPSLLVELANGSNCQVAADKICDTPPDYNFGISNCIFDREIFDRNGDTVVPMLNNFMSYVRGCESSEWTQGQIDVMRANWELDSFFGADRSFLRSSYVPTADTVCHDYSILSPLDGSTTDFQDLIKLEWESAEGATAYIVEANIATGPNPRKISEIVSGTSYDLTDIGAGAYVYWEVTAYNESYGGAPTLSSFFLTGTGAVSTKNLVHEVNNIALTPNPVNAGNTLSLEFDSNVNIPATIMIYDITGRSLSPSKKIDIKTGKNNYRLETDDFTPGVILVTINTNSGAINKKVLVK